MGIMTFFDFNSKVRYFQLFSSDKQGGEKNEQRTNGVCATDLSGELARYRHLHEDLGASPVPCRDSGANGSKYVGGGKRETPVADLCLSLFPWAKFRRRKAAVKLHTLLNLHGSIPTLVIITSGKVHDVNILDELPIEAGAFYIMDRGYLDFKRLYRIHGRSNRKTRIR